MGYCRRAWRRRSSVGREGSTCSSAEIASLRGKPRAMRASRASSCSFWVVVVGRSVAPYFEGIPTLSRRSTMMRSAVFLPTPVAFAIKAVLEFAMALRISSASARERIAMAALGPTP